MIGYVVTGWNLVCSAAMYACRKVKQNAPAIITGGALALGAGGVAMADEPAFTLADTGVDVGEAITTTITAIGAVILVALGGWFAFRLLRRALGWARKAF